MYFHTHKHFDRLSIYIYICIYIFRNLDQLAVLIRKEELPALLNPHLKSLKVEFFFVSIFNQDS